MFSKLTTVIAIVHPFVKTNFHPFIETIKPHEIDKNNLFKLLQCFFIYSSDTNLKEHELFMSEKLRSEDFNGLNRHEVMHGKVINYGTELNSLKAIYFLSAINVLLSN